MRFGLSGCGGGFESVQPAAWASFARHAEDLGFSSLWLNEEHFQRPTDGRGRLCLSPLIVAATMAACTTRIRIGFSVLLLPLHHPVRLAEEIATLDVLSGGRVDFGISRGGNKRYSDAYQVDPEKGKQAFESSLAFILKCWGKDEVDIGTGRYDVLPKPLQQPYPPVYIGTYHDEVAAWATRSGHRLIQHGIESLSTVRRILKVFESEGGAVRDVPVGRFLYVSETDASAKRELMPVVQQLTKRLRELSVVSRSGGLTEAELEPERFYADMVIAGGPSTCRGKIADLSENLGVQYLNGLCSFFGYLPEENLRRSLELFAAEVMPALM